jgi:ubiquinone/menaquinone biosynthesis C-methylase UbiE
MTNNFIDLLEKELKDCNSILELGCGKNSPLQNLNGLHYKVGVDLYGPYLTESKKARIHDRYIKADIRKINFKKNSFDAVVLIDVLEHLTKNEGNSLIRKMEKWAKKKIILFTPNGYVPQEEYDKNKLQLHKSGWNEDELKNLGFKVYGINGWKFLRGFRARIRFKPKILWEIISSFTQIFTYKHPEYAFQLFCVKEKNES